VPVMRSGAGNVIWFFGWTALLAVGINFPKFDYTGMGTLVQPLQETVRALDPVGYKGGFAFTLGGSITGETLRTFHWDGIAWTAPIIMARLVWVGIAAVVAILAALAFHRFDPARTTLRDRLRRSRATGLEQAAERPVALEAALFPRLSPVAQTRSRFAGLVVSELRLLLSGRKWWWYAV